MERITERGFQDTVRSMRSTLHYKILTMYKLNTIFRMKWATDTPLKHTGTGHHILNTITNLIIATMTMSRFIITTVIQISLPLKKFTSQLI